MGGVKYIAPFFDASGYSQAARDYALAIHKAGYPITLAPISFERTRPDLGEDGRILNSLVNNRIDYDKVIVHCTPDLWPQFTRFETNQYIIGYTVWEASRIHPSWVVACNRANEVWVPCDWNMEVFSESGVKTPLFKVPHATEVPDLDKIPNFNLEGVSDDAFVFYSIFQWQERKNPYGLLSAYSVAFSGVEDVVLVLKTYRFDHGGDKEQIKNLILDFRNDINLEKFPKLFLVVENMSKQEIMALHKRCDAFVLLQRAEGWGLPHFEAASCGKPVITPGYGGQVDFLTQDNSYLVDYTLTPVLGMNKFSTYYQSNQYWCEPNMEHAIQTMRHVYNNRDEAREKGRKARELISKNFTYDVVGKGIVDRLQALDGRTS